MPCLPWNHKKVSETFDVSWLDSLTKKLSRSERWKLLNTIIRDVRKNQQARIGRQQNPDGSAYQPRKPRLRKKQGKIKRRAMFAKLRTNKYMRIHTTEGSAKVYVPGQAGYIGRFHQFGLRGRVDRNSKTMVSYPKREILGLSPQEQKQIEARIISYLADGLL